MIYEIKNEFLTVSIAKTGAELISVKNKDGHEYMWDAKEGFWDSHAPILFPVCGRLLNSEYSYRGKTYKMNAHGFAGSSDFEALRYESDRLTLQICANEQTKEIYPFDFKLTADFALNGNELALTLTVENTDTDTLPYMIGWHPGFLLEGDMPIGDFKLKLGTDGNVEWYPLQNGCFVRPYGEEYALAGGEYTLNEQEIYSNDTLIFKKSGERALLSGKGAEHTVELEWSENLPYFCIWKDDCSEARFICLEPWSDVPAGGDVAERFDDRKMSRLASGESGRYSYRVKFN